MNASPRHSADDGKFGRTSSGAAFRGILLVGVAVLIGALLLWRGHDDSAATPADGNGVTPTTAEPTGPTTTTAEEPGTTAPNDTAAPPVTRPPAQVKVLVANGTGTPQGAGTVTSRLVAKGYGTLPASNARSSDIAQSTVFYREGFAEDAKQVARDLGVPEPVEAIIEPMPADPPVAAGATVERAKTADVLVILGTDDKIKQV